MKIKCLSTETEGPNATALMESGDHITLAFIDLNGANRLVHISVQGKVMVIREEKSDSCMLVRAAGVHLHQGD
jgi:hypothetical protein